MEVKESSNLELSEEEKLKLCLCYLISKMCDEVCETNTLLGKLSIDKMAKKLISELIYKKLLVYGQDLEAFANHAKRTTVNCDDVKLLVRRNKPLILLLWTRPFGRHNKKSCSSAINIDEVGEMETANKKYLTVQHLTTVIQNIGNTKETKKSRHSKKDAKPEEGEKS